MTDRRVFLFPSCDKERYDYMVKIVVVGDYSVGKSSIACRFCRGIFLEEYRSTLGVELYQKIVEVDVNGAFVRVMMQVWDTAGQEKFSCLRPAYYYGASGAIVVFDLTRLDSFNSIDRWIGELTKVLGDVPIVIVGNKVDAENRVVSLKTAARKALDVGAMFYGSSAKTGKNISDVFSRLAALMVSLSGLPENGFLI